MTLDGGIRRLREERLRDERDVVLRPADPADVPEITAFYHGLSTRSFALRFLSERPADDTLVEGFSRFTPACGTLSLLAHLGGEPGHLAGEARYVVTGDGVAELGIAVRDDLSGLGLGTILLAAIRDAAAAHGIARLLAVVSVVNRPMLGLLTTLGWAATDPLEGEVAFLEISTDGGMPGWPVTSARKVLVEGRSWFDNGLVAALRDGDNELRRCQGPNHAHRRSCPLIVSGSCRLAEGADLIVNLLPGADPLCRELERDHRRRWPDRLDPGRSGDA
jgi:GNAT superfamily N-acetyltransferase